MRTEIKERRKKEEKKKKENNSDAWSSSSNNVIAVAHQRMVRSTSNGNDTFFKNRFVSHVSRGATQSDVIAKAELSILSTACESQARKR